VTGYLPSDQSSDSLDGWFIEIPSATWSFGVASTLSDSLEWLKNQHGRTVAKVDKKWKTKDSGRSEIASGR
jgi:hypothetical protein